ncbi:hypothetical protein RB597_005213 [Gaeumannomyces tritici]
MIANGSPYCLQTSPNGHRCFGRPRVHALLAWLSTRVLRGGPRLLLQVTACILVVYLVTTTLPQRASDVAFGRGYSALWKWAGRRTGGRPAVDDGSVAGGLRVVVFGASDMATIPDGDDATSETTWSEVMCTELDCSTYISLVPKASSRALSSNTLYASVALPKADADPENPTPPGLDYSFYPELFPVPSDVPDFSKQVTEFLSRPRPQLLPKETLWVFNFGHWDIWNLAALPLKTSQPVVEAMVDEIALNIERLYIASVDEKSIAHSDFLFRNSTAAATWADGKAAKGTARAQAIAEAQEAAKNEPEEKETFRIVVPMIFDQTLAPGWRTERPSVPAPHSKAEQQRNAATLAELWNQKLQMVVTEWAKKENPKPQDEAPASADDVKEASREERDGPKPLSRRADDASNGGAQPAASTTDAPSFRMISRRSDKGENQEQSHPPPPKAYPLRDAIIYDLQEYLTEIMVERQLRNVGYVDQNGLGSKPEALGFGDIQTPCVKRAAKAPPPPPPPLSSSPPSMRTTKRRSGSDERKPAGKAAGLGGEVCDSPNDRLFYTAFTLSPRAVGEMGREIAELVVENHTLRQYWESNGTR